jgi:hypothetical protein
VPQVSPFLRDLGLRDLVYEIWFARLGLTRSAEINCSGGVLPQPDHLALAAYAAI